MSTELTSPESDVFKTIEVRDPNGHQTVLLEGIRASATTAEIKARAQSSLRLPQDVTWNLRDEHTGRLFQENQRLDDVVDMSSPQIELTVQPDAGLG